MSKTKITKAEERPYRPIRVEVSIPDFDWWLREAQRRNMTMADLIGKVLESVIEDELLPAILDEQEEGGAVQ